MVTTGGPRAARAGAVVFEPPGTPVATLLARAQEGDRLVLVDLVTDTCSWCKVLERETFPSSAVAAALGPTLCARLDAEQGDGAALVRRFAVRAYPTVLFLDAAGEEVDRVTGFLPAPRFAAEVTRIRAGDGTRKALRIAHERDPASGAAAVAYARKLARAGETGAARALLEPVAAATPPDPARAGALLGLAEVARTLGDDERALAFAAQVTDEHPKAPEAGPAWVLRVRLHAHRAELDRALALAAQARERTLDADSAVAIEQTTWHLLRARSEAALVRWGERASAAGDAEEMADAAAAAAGARLALGAAERWAEDAARRADRAPFALVAWAEVLEAVGRREKARALATEATERARPFEQALLARAKRLLDAADGAAPPAPPAAPAPAAPTPPRTAPAAPTPAPAPPAPAPGRPCDGPTGSPR